MKNRLKYLVWKATGRSKVVRMVIYLFDGIDFVVRLEAQFQAIGFILRRWKNPR